MDVEDFLAVFAIRQVDSDAAVKTPWAQKRRIEHVWAVGRSHHDDFFVGLETVHLDEDLVECLLTFVVAATDAGTTHAADRVYFVDEDYRGSIFLGSLEKIAHTARTDS